MQTQQQTRWRSLQVNFAFYYGEPLGSLAARLNVRHAVRECVRQREQQDARRKLALGVHRASALLLQTYAVGLRALGLKSSAYVLHNSPVGPCLAPLRALAEKLPGTGQQELEMLRSAASARRKTSGAFQAARSAPDPDPFPRLRLGQNRVGVGRASRLKQRISRAWERSFRFRSLGLTHASATTGFLRAGALRSPFAAWGGSLWLSGAWGHLRGCPARAGAILAKKKSLALSAGASQQTCRALRGKLPVVCERSTTKTAAFMFGGAHNCSSISRLYLRRKTIYGIASR